MRVYALEVIERNSPTISVPQAGMWGIVSPTKRIDIEDYFKK